MHPWRRSDGDSSGDWRPDGRASLAAAAVAGLLAMTGFAALFSSAVPIGLSQSAPGVREVLVLAQPTPRLPRPIPRARAPRPELPVQLPELQRLPPVLPAPLMGPDSFSLQEYLDERARENAAALKDQVTGGDLRRNLGRSTGNEALPDNQGYRTVDGQKVVRSGDSCAQIQTVQGSSSPTNKIDIAEPLASCPGASDHDMGKALDDWAKKVRQSQQPPPR
jgi:hypothetical protein